MAVSRLRANKQQYFSLVTGIFLAIFLISTLFMSIWCIYQAELQKRHDKVGYIDMVVLDNAVVTDDDLQSFNEIDQIGHAYISGIVTERNVYVGYYDNVGLGLMDLRPVAGRFPEAAGEIALEASAMDILGVSWTLGESVELDIAPVGGTSEKCSFTVVGILPERSVYLSFSDHGGLNQFPAIITSVDEPGFAIDGLGCHFLLGLSPKATLDQTILAFWDRFQNDGVIGDFYGLSITGEHRTYASLRGFVEADEDMLTLIMMSCLLAGSLILSCGVGISGAMESVLSKQQEEIGIFRALGSTQKQIQRIFGRENLLLGLVISPISILISMVAVWVLSILFPSSLKFVVNPWLIIPIVLFSIVVILLSGYLPLARASKQMPMNVIGDTAMLGVIKGAINKKEFSVPKLISTRQIQVNFSRQIGASLLVGLMLLCSGLLSASIFSYLGLSIGDHEAFRISASSSWQFQGHIGQAQYSSLNKQNLSQILGIENVHSIVINRHMTVTALLDHVPSYALVAWGDTQFGMLDDEKFEKAMEYQGNNANYWRQKRDEDRKAYQDFLKEYNISNNAFRMTIVSLDLNAENIDKLKPYIESGEINVEAINVGNEVLVIAPEIWVKIDESGYSMNTWDSEEAAKNDPNGDGAFLAAWNDSFTSGEELQLIQLYRTKAGGPITRVDATPSIGAVLSWDADLVRGAMSDVYIVSTEQGLENMGFPMEGLWQIKVYLDGDLSLEEEELLERQLNAISRRNDGYTVINYLENYREREAEKRQEVLLFTAIAIIFFSASVGMIVTATTRQLHSEGRTIGMLRAVGANEKTICDCYSGRVSVSVIGGMGISLALLMLYFLVYIVDAFAKGCFAVGKIIPFAIIFATIIVLGFFCLYVCKILLHFRIRESISKSIIDNIREL